MSWADPLDQSARAILQAMANGLWQGLALTVLVWCLLRLIPRLSATTRYAVWFVTLLGVAALPLLPLLPAVVMSQAPVPDQRFAELAPTPLEKPPTAAMPATTPATPTRPATPTTLSTPTNLEIPATMEPSRDRQGAVLPLRLRVGDGAADLLIVWCALAFLGLDRKSVV